MTLAAFGIMVAKAEGRATPYSPGAVGQWISGANEPSLKALAAMAKVGGLHPSELAFGDVPTATPYTGTLIRGEDLARQNEGPAPEKGQEPAKHRKAHGK